MDHKTYFACLKKKQRVDDKAVMQRLYNAGDCSVTKKRGWTFLFGTFDNDAHLVFRTTFGIHPHYLYDILRLLLTFFRRF